MAANVVNSQAMAANVHKITRPVRCSLGASARAGQSVMKSMVNGRLRRKFAATSAEPVTMTAEIPTTSFYAQDNSSFPPSLPPLDGLL